MEKKFDDQHAKVMRLNATLKDNSRSLERIEEEKKGLQFELNNVKLIFPIPKFIVLCKFRCMKGLKPKKSRERLQEQT